tara:strand:- start:3501 stop:3704 length:204 start_codon:yes stop_codon:yes gene_type:complete
MCNKNKLNFFTIVLSILSSFIGIQSDKNRKRDFANGKPYHFIIVGIIVTILFIISLYSLVKIILYLL